MPAEAMDFARRSKRAAGFLFFEYNKYGLDVIGSIIGSNPIREGSWPSVRAILNKKAGEAQLDEQQPTKLMDGWVQIPLPAPFFVKCSRGSN